MSLRQVAGALRQARSEAVSGNRQVQVHFDLRNSVIGCPMPPQNCGNCRPWRPRRLNWSGRSQESAPGAYYFLRRRQLQWGPSNLCGPRQAYLLPWKLTGSPGRSMQAVDEAHKSQYSRENVKNKHGPKAGNHGEAGFSLLEVLIATTIIGLTLIALMQLLLVGFKAKTNARQRTAASILGEKILQEYVQPEQAYGTDNIRENGKAITTRYRSSPNMKFPLPRQTPRVFAILFRLPLPGWKKEKQNPSI